MEWYPTPSHLVKRQAMLDFLVTLKERDFLEVGCGAGDLLYELEKMGYEGLGIDFSAEAVAFARGRLRNNRIEVEEKSVDQVQKQYSIVIASDVIEHYEDDIDFLKKLTDKMKKGGYILITVPAHMYKWGANDDFAGHVRRYERDELIMKMAACGLKTLFIHSYGVPICNIMKPFYNRAISKQIKRESDLEEKTKESGGMHLFLNMKLVFQLFFNNVTMYPFYVIQKLFYSSELGNAYILAAKNVKQ